MSGSDRYLSMSLDDIIKFQRKQKSRGSNSSNSQPRGQRGNNFNRGQRGQQRNNRGNFSQRGQQQRQLQQTRGNRRGGFRGNQRQGTNPRGNQQFAATQKGRMQRQWQGNGVRGWAVNMNVVNRQQNMQSRGRGGRRGATARGELMIRVLRQSPLKNTQQRGTRTMQMPRGPQRLSATQLARNRVRLAAQVLMQRKAQLQNLQTVVRPQATSFVRQRGRGQRRGGVTVGRTVPGPAASFSIRGSRRGALINRLNARQTVMQKMARASRNRQNLTQAPGTMLKVNIENERAMNPVFEMPELVVVNDLPRNTRVPPSNVRIPPPSPVRLRPSYALQPDLQVEAEFLGPSTSKPRLTLHERFAAFTS